MVYIVIILGIFFVDFFIKKYIDEKYELKKRKVVFRKRLFLEKYYNEGAALNFLESHPRLLKKIQTFLMAGVGMWFYFSLKRQGGICQKIGMSFLIGGGLSNLFDRYTKGHVVDYLKFGFGPKWFRKLIFNVSDFFVFIGGILLVLGQK